MRRRRLNHTIVKMSSDKVEYYKYSTLDLSDLDVDFGKRLEKFDANTSEGFYVGVPKLNGKMLGVICPFLECPFGYKYNEKFGGNMSLFVDDRGTQIPQVDEKFISNAQQRKSWTEFLDVTCVKAAEKVIEKYGLSGVQTKSILVDWQDKQRNHKHYRFMPVRFNKDTVENNGKEFAGIMVKYDTEKKEQVELKNLEEIGFSSFVRCGLVLNTFYLQRSKSGEWYMGYSFYPTQIHFVPSDNVAQIDIEMPAGKLMIEDDDLFSNFKRPASELSNTLFSDEEEVKPSPSKRIRA